METRYGGLRERPPMKFPSWLRAKPFQANVRLGSMFGVPIHLHVSFLIVVGLVMYIMWPEGIRGVIDGLLFITAAYVCVVLHEFGHILTARHFGIPTRKVWILPIGGVALLERLPEKPREELWVIGMGPAVNFVLAVALAPVVWALYVKAGSPDWMALAEGTAGGPLLEFVLALALWNVIMMVFNLLPAFPMDGGRILRALLQFRFGRLQATRYAVNVARVMALAMIVFSIWQSMFTLGLVAVFVLVVSRMELRMEKRRALQAELDALQRASLAPAESLST